MKDFSKINDLPAEVKLLIVNGHNLIEQTKKALEDYRFDFDLTSKRELKSDYKQVEKYITLISNGKVTEKNIKGLENAITKLQTILTGLVSFFTR